MSRCGAILPASWCVNFLLVVTQPFSPVLKRHMPIPPGWARLSLKNSLWPLNSQGLIPVVNVVNIIPLSMLARFFLLPLQFAWASGSSCPASNSLISNLYPIHEQLFNCLKQFIKLKRFGEADELALL